MTGNNSGRRQPGNSSVPSTVGRLGVNGFWVRDYGGGGPGRPPCWRTLEESCKGLGSVSLKINNQHTHLALPVTLQPEDSDWARTSHTE